MLHQNSRLSRRELSRIRITFRARAFTSRGLVLLDVVRSSIATLRTINTPSHYHDEALLHTRARICLSAPLLSNGHWILLRVQNANGHIYGEEHTVNFRQSRTLHRRHKIRIHPQHLQPIDRLNAEQNIKVTIELGDKKPSAVVFRIRSPVEDRFSVVRGAPSRFHLADREYRVAL
jgi:hypothetical protein